MTKAPLVLHSLTTARVAHFTLNKGIALAVPIFVRSRRQRKYMAILQAYAVSAERNSGPASKSRLPISLVDRMHELK